MTFSPLSSFHLDSVIVEKPQYSNDSENIHTTFINHVAGDMDAGAAQAFRIRCQTFFHQSDLPALLDTFLNSLMYVNEVASVDDTIARFSVLFCLVPAELFNVLISRISSVVVSMPPKTGVDARQDHEMRVKILRNLYGFVDLRSAAREEILVTILQYSKENKVFSVLDSTAAGDIEELFKIINFPHGDTEDSRREIYKLLSDLSSTKTEVLGASMDAAEVKQMELKHHRFLIKLLETYETSPNQLSDAMVYAARAALFSVKYPLPGDMADSDALEQNSVEGLKRGAVAILAVDESKRVLDWAGLTASASVVAQFAATKHLSSKAEYSTLYSLLEIFACKDLSHYLEFVARNPGFIASIGLREEDCLRNIRFLTLASLASNSDTVTYSAIADALRIKTDEVERWVIEGISCKVIDAKMDQSTQSIVISRGSQRLFSTEQWKEVHSKILRWKSDVHSLLSTVKSVQEENLTTKTKN